MSTKNVVLFQMGKHINGEKASGMDPMWGELIFFYPFSDSELLDGYDYSIFNPTTSIFPSGVGIIPYSLPL